MNKELMKTCEQLLQFKVQISKTSECHKLDLRNHTSYESEIEKFGKNKPAIYVFSYSNGSKKSALDNSQKLYNTYATFKDKKIGKKLKGEKFQFEKIPYVPKSFNNSTTVYVGSSLNISKRLLEHLGPGLPSTYSLQFRSKELELEKKLVRGLSLKTYFLPSGLPRSHARFIEGLFWEELRPFLGRHS